ncbi:MAG: beta-propeller repeat protein, partial [Bryobacterales bacterium]|nr:beta-propeller repeat protein [Bryobacterales bacterium]
MKLKLLFLTPALAATLLVAQPAPGEQVGPLPDGGVRLTSGWRIKPAGTVIPVDTFPMSTLITPDKKFLLVLHGGVNPPSITVIDIASAKELSRTPVPDAWLGFTMSKAGDKVYVGGGARAAVFEFTLANGVLKAGRTFPLFSDKERRPSDLVGDVQFAPDGHLLYVADLFRDNVAVVNPQSGFILSRFKTGRRPYRILFHPSGKSFYVSSWADGSIGQYETNKGERIGTVRLGPHPTDMVWKDGEIEDHPEVKARVFVSASNTNNVFVLGASESGELSRLETVNLAMTARQPLGMTPAGLGLNSDGTRLFVACSDANAAAVVDISGPRSRLAGFVPTGWYPTAAFGLPDGRMGVLNGKGQASVQLVEVPDGPELDALTHEVAANSPYRDEKLADSGALTNSPVRANGPVKHVVYIVKEGQSYDQVLGDVKGGRGDAALAVFGEQTTPNQHKLAREFVLLDNFHVNAEGGADGLHWAMAGISPDYTERMAPGSYSGRR